MDSTKKKQYYIVKREPTQNGGQIFFRYYVPGMMPRDPTAVGLYASPMMNKPTNFGDGIEIARSIGKVIAPRSDVTIPGRVFGSPVPGVVTVPNRPILSPCGHLACLQGPCQQQCVIPGFAAVPIRKGNPQAGVFDFPLIRGAPYFPYGQLGLQSTQEATMRFTIGPIKYKVVLPYGEINNILQLLGQYDASNEPKTITIEISMPNYGWYWPLRVRTASLSTFADIFSKLISIKDVKFYNETDGRQMTVEEVRSSLVSYVDSASAAALTRSEQEKQKLNEVKAKLSETPTNNQDEQLAAEYEKKAAEIRARMAAKPTL